MRLTDLIKHVFKAIEVKNDDNPIDAKIESVYFDLSIAWVSERYNADKVHILVNDYDDTEKVARHTANRIKFSLKRDDKEKEEKAIDNIKCVIEDIMGKEKEEKAIDNTNIFEGMTTFQRPSTTVQRPSRLDKVLKKKKRMMTRI